MKYTLPIVAAAGLASAYVSDYSFLAARDLADYDAHISLIARALDEYDAAIYAREAAGGSSRRGSTASSHEMQPLSRTNTGGGGSPSRSNSWDSLHAETDAHGKKQASGVGRSEGDQRDASRTHQAQNAAQRTAGYVRKNPLEATSSALSSMGSIIGTAGAISGAHGNAAGAAGCAAGAAACNGAANLIDKFRAGKKTASGKSKRDLYARALMAEIAMGAYPEIEARSYDDDIWADEYYY